MYRVEHNVGRLVEIAISSPVSLEEAARWGADHDAVVSAVGGPYACFVDLRGASVFPPEVVEAYVGTMKGEYELLCTGTLLPNSSLVALQIGRMIREAGHPQRRPFETADALFEWMSPQLSVLERGRLRGVLDQAPLGA